jgi:hypothetical protein
MSRGDDLALEIVTNLLEEHHRQRTAATKSRRVAVARASVPIGSTDFADPECCERRISDSKPRGDSQLVRLERRKPLQ